MKSKKMSQKGTPLNLKIEQIDAVRNIRRACPKLINRGYEPWNLVSTLVTSKDANDNLEFIKLISIEKKILTLAASILQSGQIHSITAIKSKEKDKFINVAGQRRCIAISLLEAIRKVYSSKVDKIVKEMNKVLKDAMSEIINPDPSEGYVEETDGHEYFGQDNFGKNPFTISVQVVELTEEEIDEIACDENNETLPMSELDWGYEFKRMLETINPKTGSFYTIKEVSNRHKKSYTFVRTRSAWPYLYPAWKEKIDELFEARAMGLQPKDAINLTEATNEALKLKAEAESKILDKIEEDTKATSEIIEEESKPKKSKEEKKAKASASKKGKKEEEEETPAAPISMKGKIKKKKGDEEFDPRLSFDEIKELIINTPRTNKVRIEALAETIQLSFEDAMILLDEAV